MGQVQVVKTDIRSKDIIFLPFCLICRGVVAQGLVKEFSSVVKPILLEIIRRDINIVQMSCPEVNFGGWEHGLKRKPKLKSDYDCAEFHSHCRGLARETVDKIEALHKNGFRVRAILGIEYSPSCAVNYVLKSYTGSYSSKGYTSHGAGIFMEQLQAELEKRDLKILMIGVHLRGMEKTLRRLKEALDS